MPDLPRRFTIREGSHRILNPYTSEKLATLGDALRLRHGMRLLDLASGKGELLCTWARDYGVAGTGVDISTAFTEAARTRAVELGVENGCRSCTPTRLATWPTSRLTSPAASVPPGSATACPGRWGCSSAACGPVACSWSVSRSGASTRRTRRPWTDVMRPRWTTSGACPTSSSSSTRRPHRVPAQPHPLPAGVPRLGGVRAPQALRPSSPEPGPHRSHRGPPTGRRATTSMSVRQALACGHQHLGLALGDARTRR